MPWFRWRKSEPPNDEDRSAPGDEPGDAPDDAPDEGDDDDVAEAGIEVFEEIERTMALAQRSIPVEPGLAEARLADLLRDIQTTPMAPQRFASWSSPLDESDWRKLAIATELLSSWLSSVMRDDAEPPDVYAALSAQIASAKPVSVDLLATSDVRAEEFVRRLAMALSLPIVDESPRLSRSELEKLDYNVLLEKVNSAKLSAEERMARLRQLQESQDHLRRRGKW